MNKIYGHRSRPADGAPLCNSCSYATRVEGTRFGDDFTKCGAIGRRVTFHVTECSSYENKAMIPVYQLEQVAWRFYEGRLYSPADLMRLRKKLEAEEEDD